MKIYGFFDSTRVSGDAVAVAIDEEGRVLATHVSSDEYFAKADLGMDGVSKRKHDLYSTVHPDGWECEFVPINSDRDTHGGLQAAISKYREARNASTSPM